MIRNLYTALFCGLLCACQEPSRPVSVALPPGATVDSNVLVLPASTGEPAAPRVDSSPVILRTPPDSSVRATVVPAAPVVQKPLFEILRSAQPDLQIFTISGNEDRLLTAKSGTLIGVRRDAFVLPDGRVPSGPIRFTVQEFYGLGDALSADLTTRSGDRLLETGGMLYLEASSGSERLLLRPGATVDLAFPVESPLPGMQLFTGARQQGAMDWALLPDPSAGARVPVPVYEPASFPGGMEELRNYLVNSIAFPHEMLQPGKEQALDVRFLVDPSGKARPLPVAEEVPRSFQEGVAAAFTRMPRWKPAQRLGIAVTDTFTQSFRFGGRMSLSLGGDMGEAAPRPEREEVARFVPTMSTVQYYVFRSTRLGYLNCDRFLQEGRPLTEYFVHTGAADDVQVRLVFHSLRSLIDGHRDGDVYRFPRVPVGEKVTIVAVRQKDGVFSMAMADGNTSTRHAGDFTYEPVNEATLKQKIKRLNRL
ncbi:hypothetical protein [Flaviaesturariibacter amylovorans]|uniref:TonB C-terminal domain-containing protein n=1 Tax=Flaviaesturariibacter amylovorans TaxID=1084520 RepID=A0ABP8G9K0_9BACT